MDIHHALEPDEDVRPDLFGKPGLEGLQIVILARQHGIEAGLFWALGQQCVNPNPLLRIIKGIRPPQMLPWPVMRDRNRDVMVRPSCRPRHTPSSSLAGQDIRRCRVWDQRVITGWCVTNGQAGLFAAIERRAVYPSTFPETILFERVMRQE